MRRNVVGVLTALIAMAVFAGAMIPLRSHLSEAMTALVLVVPIIIGVVVGGLWAGVISVVAAFVVYVYFFVPPYLTTSIGRTENWVALAVYLAITFPVASVVDRMHAARAAERRRSSEIRQLLELSELLVEDRPVDDLLSTVVAAVYATFDASQVAILLPGPEGLGVVASAGAPVTASQLRELSSTRFGPSADRRSTVGSDEPLVLPLSAAGRPIGLLVLGAVAQPDHDSEALLLFANQIALAVERVQLRDQVIRTQLAEQVDRLAKMLVTAASHDLRTPLASIKASSSILSDASLDLDSTVAHDLARLIDDQADRLADLVQNLLDMGRIQAGVLQPRVVSTTVRELVDTVVCGSASVLDQYTVEVELADELPSVTVDPMLIDRVLANLLANAVRYAPKNSSIRIVARTVAPDCVEVSVVDRGPGVSRERQVDIFGLNARRNEDSGAGLGLIIAKTFVEAHRQRIWVDDAPGGGARFSFTLPVGPTSPEHALPAVERSSSVGADSHH